MELLLDKTEKKAREALDTEAGKSFASPSFGEVLPLSVAIIERIKSPVSGRIWNPQSLAGWTIRAAIGKSFQLPIAGSFTLTFGANTTGQLQYDASAATIAAALNALASIIVAGGVTVSGSSGYFITTFALVGSRVQITADVANLAPLSIGEVGTLIEGTATLREVQTLRLIQNPGAYAVLAEESEDQGAMVEVVAEGGVGVNHKIRVGLDPLPYDGRWSLTIGGEESGLLAWDITEDALTDELESMASVGDGNVSVFLEQEGSYLIGFKADHAGEDMGAITADGSGLKVIPYLSGDLSLRTPGIELLLAGAPSVAAFLEIEGTPPGGLPQKLYKQACTVVSAVIDPASLEPQPRVVFYTAAECDALFVPRFVELKYRYKPDGTRQIYNPDSGLYHSEIAFGPDGAAGIMLADGEA